jgi:alpha-L-fucosidase
MTRRRLPYPLTVVTAAMLGIACSSGGIKGGRAGSGPGGGGASGGAGARGTGGADGTGGNEPGGSGGIPQGGAGGSVTPAGFGGTMGIDAETGVAGSDGGGGGSGGSAGATSVADGAVGTGGQASSGGNRGTGGVVGTGGAASFGGVVGTGGVAGSGGAPGTGGETGTGGGAGTGGVRICPIQAGTPTGTPPLPSPAQLAYQRTELTAAIYYALTTYEGSESCSVGTSPSLFAPTKLDATSVGEWASSLKGAGFGQSMLVAKHQCGFCLWPSAFTDYSVKSSPWQGGQGDVVALWTDAAHASGMRAALAVTPMDVTYGSGKADYETYFKNQLAELLRYGAIHEIAFDGFDAPTTVDWKSVYQTIKQAQPDALIWAGPELAKTGAIPDLQWIGNENGVASRTTSSLDTKYCGNGATWCPYECNVSSYRPRWFWHPGTNPIALSDLQQVYFQSVGMNCTLNLGVPPSRTGELDPKNLKLLQDFGTWYASLFRTNLIAGQPATADSTWASPGFAASQAVDGDICTYWAAASGATTARLEVTPSTPVTAKLISIREAIELGERVQKYHVEIEQDGTWKTAPLDASGKKLQGTVIGNRQLWQLAETTIEAVALVVEAAKAPPAIAELGMY